LTDGTLPLVFDSQWVAAPTNQAIQHTYIQNGWTITLKMCTNKKYKKVPSCCTSAVSVYLGVSRSTCDEEISREMSAHIKLGDF
jgi:hypothetical protein